MRARWAYDNLIRRADKAGSMAAMSPCIVKGDGRTIVQFNVSQISNA